MATDFLHGIETIELSNGARPIQVAKSSVIGYVGTAKRGPEMALIKGSRTEGSTTYGDVDGISTIPDGLDAIFDQTGAMVVVINVCDPTKHLSEALLTAYTFSKLDVIKLAHTDISEVLVKDAEGETTYTAADYDVDLLSGKITRKAGGAIAASATVKVSYSYVDPSLVTLSDIIGGTEDGELKGVHLLRRAQSEFGVTPRILIAPGYTHQRPDGLANPVVAELLGLAPRLRAVVLADGPNSTDEAAVQYRMDYGSDRVFIIDPWPMVFDVVTNEPKVQPPTMRVAGMLARRDNEQGFWWSPSNMIIEGAIGMSRPVDWYINDVNCAANYLNSQQVTTIIRNDGFRLWGNRSPAQDPLWAFLSVRRTADMVYESLEQGLLWIMDRPIIPSTIEDLEETVNAFLRKLKAMGALLGGEAWLPRDLNSATELQAGHVYLKLDLEPPAPLERLTIYAQRNGDYYIEALDNWLVDKPSN